MKLIILAAGSGNISLSDSEKIPKCLENYDKSSTILDSILSACNSSGIKEYCIVGGFEILKIMQEYPNLKYYYNEIWQDTRSLYSFLKASNEFNSDLVISFSDIVYDGSVIEQLIKSEEDITIAYDSLWKKRFEGRTRDILDDAVKVYAGEENNVFISKDGNGKIPIGEFVGIVSLKHKVVKNLVPVMKTILNENKKAHLGELVSYLSEQHHVNLIDVMGKWAELDSPQDLMQFRFGTKAETLMQLESSVRKSKILPQINFTLKEYKENNKLILRRIRERFDTKKIIIRSSALNEDCFKSSMAGHFESILDIDINDKVSIFDSIEKVQKSYLRGNQEKNSEDQVLVQPHLEGVTLSGVLFTKDLETSAPYYIINYEITDKTNTITSGMGKNLKTFVYYRFAETLPEDEELINIIKAVKELEAITGFDSLDVEFAIANNDVYILQVRPIAAHKDSLKIYNKDIFKELNNIKGYIKQHNRPVPKLAGARTAYGIMPDWNPAEIIGINPSILAFSIYRHIITDDIWPISRELLGYRDTTSYPGIVSFCGKPYVDVRMSFNSFTPASIPKAISENLINFYINKLQSFPEYHDKVEFKVAITAYDFELENKLHELKNAGFRSNDIVEIREALRKLTNDIITEKNISIEEEINKTKLLDRKRAGILKSHLPVEDKIVKLLDDCKIYGTLPFSLLARFAFVSSLMMKSLLSIRIITQSEYDIFFKSINTVAKDFVTDLNKLATGQIFRDDFLQTYGHLRPGTYDITSKTYKENFNNYVDTKKEVQKEETAHFELSDEKLKLINQQIKGNRLSFDAEILFKFSRKAIEARELAKFEFTKNVSAVLDLTVELMKEMGITRKEASYLDIEDIISISKGSRSLNLENELYNRIIYNKEKQLISRAIRLPEIIFREKDVDYFYLSPSQPNFITQKSIIEDTVHLTTDTHKIDNKIVLIENADPGFDWIFSHNIKGIITRYGGAASHMAIRCAEFDLPAAIGCGDVIFEHLKNYNKIGLDCSKKSIKGLL